MSARTLYLVLDGCAPHLRVESLERIREYEALQKDSVHAFKQNQAPQTQQ